MGALSLHPDLGLPLQLHRARLEEAVALFSFYGSCRELQSWLEEQTALFQTLQPQGDNLEVTQLKCEVSCCANGDRPKFSPPWRCFCLPIPHCFAPFFMFALALSEKDPTAAGLTLRLGTQMLSVKASMLGVLEPTIPRPFGPKREWGEKSLPPRVLGPSLQNFLVALAIGKGHWAEVINTAEQLKQRCPGHTSKIQQQEEDLNQR